ncbi:MAG: cyclic nucleotide-binding domain-containing protein, partial [Nitrospinaceae bacterium]|nr:cyclic nucleotide-binding domain-containing protein [Nitrospinaceae bacterium]NIR57444.1 cyclic nucleotide-binding domain-containing protein [Nitrospinaceae bacterium]NIS87911.1 cyclic nucleotide-binding domain-containing protein [Nitrospinaceae bacterium]NIT84780.1 cyclic nucleotide-binding domain-containing protein [Nitrospinaceae bacterium]NIU46954.1 cyclic nucleotide-binding domain-containing protein [Nitrospinaceae bacterium]
VVVGELSLLEEAPRPVTAVTVTPTTLLEISRADLFRHFEDHPRVGLTVLKNLGRSFCERWRRSERGYRDPLLWKGVPDD